MKRSTIKKRKFHKECWNLNSEFLKWLKERLPVYLHDAENIVDLEYRLFEYKGNKFTQKQLIKKMIHNLSLIKNDCDPDYEDLINEVLEIWVIIFPAMWW